MSKKDDNNTTPCDMSRRHALQGIGVTVVAIAAGVAAGLKPGTARASACPGVAPKATMEYQDHPKGKDECDICANFIAPHCCKIVAGPIVPTGWCMAFTPKAA